MAIRKTRAKSSEFPILEANGLYAAPIKGDGNCLFNALSDQMYGTQDAHKLLRATTISHMRKHATHYRQYMVVNPTRRNSRRRTAAASANIDTTVHSEDELQEEFEKHLEKMGKTGEWADNLEVAAFADALNVNVCLWHADYTYTFSPQVTAAVDDQRPAVEDQRSTLNIAYHTWEHYSSVRNVAGPHTGVPNVVGKPAPAEAPVLAPDAKPADPEFKSSPSKKRSSAERDDEELLPVRATKRRSPLPPWDSEFTPSGSEASSDESLPTLSQQEQVEDVPQRKIKLVLKLRVPPKEQPV
ncbi:OTU-domain-containing protein [Amniculicola lignicola CBS 123094]|uniref:OTU-domain-containing protein n=1 Tax=Amniculicola lignicola CBS 123094 TaxID=1392246 RepID=A0A6A5W0P5_9PLEO|nr:OTU-domain-containing protein [Amniculicola lignicola CBS 123094]